MAGHGITLDTARRIAQRNREHDEMYAVFKKTGGGSRGDIIVGRRLAYVGGTAVTARSGTTAGSGTVTMKRLNGTTIETATDAGGSDITETVYNFTESEIGPNTYTWVGQDVEGSWFVHTDEKFKTLIRFETNGAFDTSDANVLATIDTQYGYGIDHPTGSAVRCLNVETSTASTYIFEGDSGDAGLAYFHQDNSGTLEFVIVQMECP